MRTVGNTEVGKTVRVVVLRDGETVTLRVTLGRRETAEGAVPAALPAEETEPQEKDLLGLTISVLTPEVRSELNLPESLGGVIVTAIDEVSEAFEKGLRTGDVITEVRQQPIAAIADFETRIEEAKEAGRKSIVLLIRRDGMPRFLALGVGE